MDLSQLFFMAMKYLEKNPYRFTDAEKVKFMKDLQIWFEGKSQEIADEVYDFLIDVGLYKRQSREEEFISYLNKKYARLKFGKVLDVGAGRMCKMSEILTKYGNRMYALDPNIRLTRGEAAMKNFSIKNAKFCCDDYANHHKGTLVDRYDHIIGLEPCDATEHIIRQGLKYDKPFDILLCASPHNGLNRQKFDNYIDWYCYLNSISKEVNITKVGGSYYASNEKLPGYDVVGFEQEKEC